MVEIKLQVPEKLAARLAPIGPWIPTVLELSVIGFKTSAARTAAEIIDFLSDSPTPAQVLDYHVSDRAQERLRRLLVLNRGEALGADEEAELDELQKIEHVVVMLKAQACATTDERPE